ncbi:MAG TPA: HAMP domain-containing sensor histidine kinase [Anaeromyxobacter sp.]|nr:HAMP domain-containing sensor histidine kinase [Anaeromyxobacter sp.]
MRRVLLLPTLIAAGLAAAALAAIAVTSRSATRDVEASIQQVRRANALAFRLAHLAAAEEHEVLRYRVERSAAARERMDAASAGMDAVIAQMTREELPPRGRALWADAVAARALQERERRALVAALDGGAHEGATAYARWQLATGKAGPLAADVAVFNLRRLERAVSELERVRSRSVALLFTVLAASAALVVGFSLVVDRWLVRPVRAMTDAARRIASERVAIPVPGGDRRDELGVLARAMTRTADDLVRANAELGRSIAARDEFLSIASHELKTPLTALKLQLQIGERRLGAGGAPWLAAALRQVDRVGALVEELLDLARIRAGRLTLEPAVMDVAELACGVAERLADVLERSGNALRVDAPEPVGAACDAARVEQVVGNLLVNASRHAPGSHVSLRVAREADRAVLVVEDDGPGIPPDAVERVFDAYEKVDRAGQEQGLGLGLYIVRQIVEAHGGTIRAEAGGAGGARFRVELPAAALDRAEAAGRRQGGAGEAP